MTARALSEHNADVPDGEAVIPAELWNDLMSAAPSQAALAWVERGLDDADADPRRRTSGEVAAAIARLHSETTAQRRG